MSPILVRVTIKCYGACFSFVFPVNTTEDTVFSRLNAGGVYLKLGLVDPAFIRTRRLFIKCIFKYWKFIEPRTKIQQKRLKNVKQCHQLCLI